MENISEFFKIFFTTDYFLILLIIILLIILIITVHLIRIQRYYNKNDIKIDDETNKEEENFLTLNFGNEFLEEDITKTIEKEKINEKFESIEKILSGNKEESIHEYEKDEEESAIISTEELEQISKNRNLDGTNNSSLINQYEEEQEKKAIISYEELLKNASSLKLNYKEENYETDGPIVRKIELETPIIERNLNYVEETNFLSTLKDFRAQLK